MKALLTALSIALVGVAVQTASAVERQSAASAKLTNAAAVQPAFVGAPDYPHGVETRRFNGVPSITRAPNGRYWATWFSNPCAADGVNSYVVLATSTDCENWTEVFVVDPGLYAANARYAFDPQVWVDPTGRLRWFWTDLVNAAGDADHGVWMMTLDDAGSVPAAPATPRCIYDGVMLGKPSVLADGAWAFPVYQVGRDPSALLVVSADQGDTFTLRGGVTVPSAQRSTDEHSIVETAPGTLRCWIRTQDGVRESVSTDGGVTWTEAALPAVLRNTSSRLSVTKLASGNLLLVKNGALATAGDRDNLTAFLSADGGVTWSGGLLLDSRLGATYPDAVQDADGLIHVVYDHDRTGRREILMASFTEDDVVAGAETTTRTRFRQRVTGPVVRIRADAEAVPVGGALLGDHVGAVSIDSGISLSTEKGYEYTLETWVNPSGYDSENHIFGQYNGSGRMLLYLGQNRLSAFFGDDGEGAPSQRFDGVTDIPLNVWTHVAMSVRRHEVRFYVNGVLDSTHAFTPRGLPSDRRVSLGGIKCSDAVWGDYNVFQGRLADMRVWGRARTANEISRDLGCRLCGTEQDLLGYWPMSGTISNAVDSVLTRQKLAIPNAHLKIVPETELRLKPAAEVADTGCALRFDGDATQIIRTDVRLGAKDPYTLEAWVRPQGVQWEGRIISIYKGGVPGRCIFETLNGPLGMYVNTASGNEFPSDTADLPLGTWSHVALSRSGNELRFYVNGVLVRTVDGLSLLDTIDDTVVALGNCNEGEVSFNGDLRDVRVWNVVRTDAQIAANRHRRLTGREEGLRGLWLLDEGHGSAVSNRVTGVCSEIQGANWSWLAKGEIFPEQERETTPNRHAATFSGTAADAVDTGLRMPNCLNWTWEAWVNPRGYHSNDRNKIISCYNEGACGRTAFCIIGNTQLALGRWVDGAVPGKSAWLCGGYVPLNRWSHVAATFDNGTVTLYVDGEQVARDTGYALHDFPDTSVKIGGDAGFVNGGSFYGQIAEARVWNVTRTQAEIQTDFNRLLRGGERGLAGYWPLDERDGATTAANLRRGRAAATATCFWEAAELVLGDPRPCGDTVILVR